MKLDCFQVEQWMTDHENDCRYNLTDTCVEPLTISQLEQLTDCSLMDTIASMPLDYGPIVGSDDLRRAILSLYRTGDIDHIAIAQGTNNANELVMMTLLDADDHIISMTPTYQQFYEFPSMLGCRYDLVELDEASGWQADVDEFISLINDDTKMIILNSPNNPTGTVFDEEWLKALIEVCRERHIYILIDEIYRGLSADSPASISDLYEYGIATSSLSKLYSSAGLRIGWIKGPKKVIEEINQMRNYTIISTGFLTDYLGTHVLTHKETILERSRAIVNQNKDNLRAYLSHEKRLSCVIPDDGTVGFQHYHFDMPSIELAETLQKETGIFFVPGACFNAEYHLRIGFTRDPEMMNEGLVRFSQWMDEHHIE